MKKYLLPLILILFLTFTLGGYSAWLDGWDYRIEITLPDYASDIGASVTWFPVTVFLTGSQAEEVFAELTTDAEYLKTAVTKADGTTEMYAEFELFDVSETKGIFHTSKSDWTINANTSIFLYYDKDHADNTDYIGIIGLAGRDGVRENVWNPEYKMVQHKKDETTSTITDSTSNNNDGTKKGANEPNEVAGKVGQGQDFDGGDDFISVPDNASLDITAQLTLEAIIYPDALSASPQIISKDDVIGRSYYLTRRVNQKLGFRCGGLTSTFLESDAVTTEDGYHYVAGVYDSAKQIIYLDGVNIKEQNTTGSITSTGTDLYIGSMVPPAAAREWFDGKIDEVRISSTGRSPAWMKGTYNSLWDSLFTYGSEETEVVEEEVNAIFFGTNF